MFCDVSLITGRACRPCFVGCLPLLYVSDHWEGMPAMFCRVFAIASWEGEEHRAVTVKLADLLAHNANTAILCPPRSGSAPLSREPGRQSVNSSAFCAVSSSQSSL